MRAWRVFVLAGFGVLACSSGSQSGSQSGGGNSSGASACFRNHLATTCYSCLETKCGSALARFDNECDSWVKCMCPAGAYDFRRGDSCQQSTSCSDATQGLLGDILGSPGAPPVVDAGAGQPICSVCNPDCAGLVLWPPACQEDCSSSSGSGGSSGVISGDGSGAGDGSHEGGGDGGSSSGGDGSGGDGSGGDGSGDDGSGDDGSGGDGSAGDG